MNGCLPAVRCCFGTDPLTRRIVVARGMCLCLACLVTTTPPFKGGSSWIIHKRSFFCVLFFLESNSGVRYSPMSMTPEHAIGCLQRDLIGFQQRGALFSNRDKHTKLAERSAG